MKYFIIIPVLISFVIKNVTPIDCFWSSNCNYKYFSSKTPYENVRGDIRDSIIKVEGCKPVSAWTIMRHGKKNPGTTFLKHIKVVLNFQESIISSYNNGNSSLCAQDIQNFREWKVDESFINEPSIIVPEGYKEMAGIGRRLKEALPQLFEDLYEGEYLFRPTYGPRSDASTLAFLGGLENKDLLIEKAEHNHSIANPYGICKTYLNEVHTNPDRNKESLQYMETTEFKNMKKSIEKKLGLSFSLTNNHIISIYDLCRYTSDGIDNKFSPWCAVFTEEDLIILEYVGDLEHYYRSSYGVSKYSNTFGQITLSDLYINLQRAKNGKGKKSVVYFAHSSIMDMILVALNLYKDERKLTGAYRNLNRKFRSTFFSTFGANLIAVLNRCKKSHDKVDYKISFYWNERPLINLCQQGVCSWQKFENIFRPFLNATTDILCE